MLLVFRLLFEKTNVKQLEEDLSGDSTGILTPIKQSYGDDKGDEKKIKLYDVMIFTTGLKYKLLTGVKIKHNHGNENPFIIPLLKETRKRYIPIP